LGKELLNGFTLAEFFGFGKGKKELTNGQMKRVVLAYRKLIGSL